LYNETKQNSRIDKKAAKKKRPRQKPPFEKSIWPMRFCQILKRDGAMTRVLTNRISTILTLGLMVTVTEGEWEEFPKRSSLQCICNSKEEEEEAFILDS
jgi:hypothetical protein